MNALFSRASSQELPTRHGARLNISRMNDSNYERRYTHAVRHDVSPACVASARFATTLGSSLLHQKTGAMISKIGKSFRSPARIFLQILVKGCTLPFLV